MKSRAFAHSRGSHSTSGRQQRFTLTIQILATLMLFVPWPATAQTDQRIKAIDALRQKIDQDIAQSETEPEY